jgi:Protein of unknown function (DUF3553)
MTAAAFTKGEKVVHGTKPEWGIGEILRTESTRHEGTPCQRLTIRFNRAGTKVVSTAVARIEPADRAIETATEFSRDGSWLDAADPEATRLAMAKLPEAATDPFRPFEQRFEATCSLYRFSNEGGSLIDWAAAQTGLPDPLSMFNRTELELFFEKYRLNRDEHLRGLARDYGRKDPAGLERVLAQAPAAAQQALRGVNTRR